MKRLSKGILITLTVMVALFLITLLGLNLYLQSASTQARIQEELGKALGMPLRLVNTSLTPWSELKISGISIPAETENFLEATSFTARYRLFSLLRKQLEIYDLRATNPKIVWRENSEGRYVLPLRERPEKSRQPSSSKEKKESELQVVIYGFKIVNGDVEFIDQERRPIASFHGVDLNFTSLTEERIAGSLSITKILWKQLTFESITTDFDYLEGKLTLPKLNAKSAGGQIKGALDFLPEGKDVPFTADLHLQQIDLGKLMTETGWAPQQFSGTFGATLKAKGAFQKIEKVEGTGTVELTGGYIRQLDLFRTIGDVLRIPQLADLKLQDSRAQFRLGGEKVHLDKMALNAVDLQFQATGPVRFNGKLALDARLAFTERTMKQLPEFVRTTFTNTDANGQAGLDFKITGTLEKPKTDLLDRVIGNKLSSQFEDLVSSLFGKKKKEDDKKKQEKKQPAATDLAAPTESDSTNP